MPKAKNNMRSNHPSFMKRTKSLKISTQLSKIQEEDKSDDSAENIIPNSEFKITNKEKSLTYSNLQESYKDDVVRTNSQQGPSENFFEIIDDH